MRACGQPGSKDTRDRSGHSNPGRRRPADSGGQPAPAAGWLRRPADSGGRPAPAAGQLRRPAGTGRWPAPALLASAPGGTCDH